jgi:Ca2+:H+ antiporter
MRRPPKQKRVADEENIAELNDEADHVVPPPLSDAADPDPLVPSTGYEMDATNSAAGDVVRRANRGEKSDENADDAEAVADEDESTVGPEKSLYRRLFLDNPVPVGVQVRQVLFPHWYTINWLLVAVPVGIALHFIKGMSPLAIFVVNFLAIIPLAGILSFATEEIALRVGEVIGGLLNASFGCVLFPFLVSPLTLLRNAVELIVAIIALAKKEIIIVQTSLVGSMLSNLLLVMGMCFFFGGWNRMEQFFNTTVAQTAASLLALAVASLVIPTAYTWGNPNFNPASSSSDEQLSRGTAVILLIVYASYLIFQLKSHKDMYSEPSKKGAKRRSRKSMKKALAHMGGFAGASAGGDIQQDKTAQNKPEGREQEEEPTLTFIGAVVTLCVATGLVGICAEFLVDSINDVTCENNVSPYFVGLILLPIV